MDNNQCRDSGDLVKALNWWFGFERQTEIFRAQLKSRTQKRDESLPELAHAVKKAYPDAPRTLRDSLGRDHFVDALLDSDKRWRVTQARPKSLQDAVTTAVELEASQTAEQQRGHSYTRVAQATSVSSGEEKGGLHELLKEHVAGQHSLFKQLADKDGGGKQPSKPRTNSSMPSAGRTCWTCNESGHFRRDCPVEWERNAERRTDRFHDIASRSSKTQNWQGNGETRNRQGNGEPQNWQGNSERPSLGVETWSEYQQQ